MADTTRTDRDGLAPAALPRPKAGAARAGHAAGRGAFKPERWIKRFLPKTLFGRALLIIVTPLVLMQAI